jgi:hypothetical protein
MEQWFEECGCGLELLTAGLQDAWPTHSVCASRSVRLPPRRIRTTAFLEAESTRETNIAGSDRAQLAQFP